MPYEDKESYTIEEMADYLANESMSGEALLDTLSKHGFELREKKGESCGSEMVEEETLESMSSSPRRPKLNIVALRVDASKKALGKHKGGQE
mgnify:FL=1|tara:strand:+ start:7553 stop:7828 length:276 start_codon:yes stop_codon:yes gene_type:complete